MSKKRRKTEAAFRTLTGNELFWWRIYDKMLRRLSQRGRMDANSILPGDDTEMLPETYVVFITENDVFEGNYG